jgi:hypothetical protein
MTRKAVYADFAVVVGVRSGGPVAQRPPVATGDVPIYGVVRSDFALASGE